MTVPTTAVSLPTTRVRRSRSLDINYEFNEMILRTCRCGGNYTCESKIRGLVFSLLQNQAQYQPLRMQKEILLF